MVFHQGSKSQKYEILCVVIKNQDLTSSVVALIVRRLKKDNRNYAKEKCAKYFCHGHQLETAKQQIFFFAACYYLKH